MRASSTVLDRRVEPAMTIGFMLAGIPEMAPPGQAAVSLWKKTRHASLVEQARVPL